MRSKGVLPPEVDPAIAEAEKALEEAKESAAREFDPLKNRTLDELDELEEEEYADSRMIDSYRQQRLEELKAIAKRNKFGQLMEFSRSEFVKEVTEASKESWVIVLLYKDHIPDSKKLLEVMFQLAKKHPATKFLRIVSDNCIENYPDKNVPTIFLYRDGVVQGPPIIGLALFGGIKETTLATVEWVLAKREAIKTDLEEDPREVNRYNSKQTSVFSGSGRTRAYSDDD